MLGSAVFWRAIGSRGFIDWAIVLNCFVVPFGGLFLVFYSERKAKDEPPAPLTPLIRRSPATGQREL